MGLHGVGEVRGPVLLRDVEILPEAQPRTEGRGVEIHAVHVEHAARAGIRVEGLFAVHLAALGVVGLDDDIAVAPAVAVVVVLVDDEHFVLGAGLQHVAGAALIGAEQVVAGARDAADIARFAHVAEIAHVQRGQPEHIVHKSVAVRAALVLGVAPAADHVVFGAGIVHGAPIGVGVPAVFAHGPIAIKEERDADAQLLQLGQVGRHADDGGLARIDAGAGHVFGHERVQLLDRVAERGQVFRERAGRERRVFLIEIAVIGLRHLDFGGAVHGAFGIAQPQVIGAGELGHAQDGVGVRIPVVIVRGGLVGDDAEIVPGHGAARLPDLDVQDDAQLEGDGRYGQAGDVGKRGARQAREQQQERDQGGQQAAFQGGYLHKAAGG